MTSTISKSQSARLAADPRVRSRSLTRVGHEDYLRGLPEESEYFAEEFGNRPRGFLARSRIVTLGRFRFSWRGSTNTHMGPTAIAQAVIISEPYLLTSGTRMPRMARPAIAAVLRRRTPFLPTNWEKTYFRVDGNIQPWCSRASFGGAIRFPALYGLDERWSRGNRGRGGRNALGYYANRKSLSPAHGRQSGARPRPSA